ncbi:MAG TPA: hypothetical protein VGO94_00165 [Mycobacteriales bacterium]|jgi:hypothetical protein|nr:hypothetical protein [Mycobacteriales bacterium]
MTSHPDPFGEPTVGVPAQPHPEAPTAAYDAHHTPYPQHSPYPQHTPGNDVPYGSPAPGYGTPAAPPRAKGDRGALVAACLAFLVVVLGAPALVLAWRSAVGPSIVPSGLVGGLLAVTGLSVLAVGLFPLVTSRGDAQPDAGPAALLRAPVLLSLIGAILLVGAAIAV